MFPASAHTTSSESNGPRKQRAVDEPLGVETRHPCPAPLRFTQPGHGCFANLAAETLWETEGGGFACMYIHTNSCDSIRFVLHTILDDVCYQGPADE